MEKQIKQSVDRETRRERLKSLILQNQELEPGERKSKYELLVLAGFPDDVAKALSGVLIENGVQKIIPMRGVDTDGAKLVLQEIMHDPSAKDDVRLKAAEDTLKLTGALREPENGDKTSQILAGILRDIASDSRDRTRLYEKEKKLPGRS